MIGKKFKLPIGKQAFFKGKTHKTEFFVLKTTANNSDFSRFGVVLGKKILNSAVDRNRLKRIIFDFIGKEKYHLKPGSDFLIIAQKAAGEAEPTEIRTDLKGFFQKIYG